MEMWMPVDDVLQKCGCQWMMDDAFSVQKAMQDAGPEWNSNKKVVELSKKDIRHSVSGHRFPPVATVLSIVY